MDAKYLAEIKARLDAGPLSQSEVDTGVVPQAKGRRALGGGTQPRKRRKSA